MLLTTLIINRKQIVHETFNNDYELKIWLFKYINEIIKKIDLQLFINNKDLFEFECFYWKDNKINNVSYVDEIIDIILKELIDKNECGNN